MRDEECSSLPLVRSLASFQHFPKACAACVTTAAAPSPIPSPPIPCSQPGRSHANFGPKLRTSELSLSGRCGHRVRGPSDWRRWRAVLGRVSGGMGGFLAAAIFRSCCQLEGAGEGGSSVGRRHLVLPWTDRAVMPGFVYGWGRQPCCPHHHPDSTQPPRAMRRRRGESPTSRVDSPPPP